MKRFFPTFLFGLSLFSLVSIAIVLSCSRENSAEKSFDQNPAYNYVSELRGVWLHGAMENWDSTMAALKDAGFNAIFPNMNSGGAALYPSEFLPMTSEKDELALCIEAAHNHGIEVHAWRVNWYMMGCPDSFSQAMEKAGRIQYAYNGKRGWELDWELDRDWLCPSHPDNRKLELDTMLEFVKKYDVDGVHFDYMRYGREEMCYCRGCKENFEKETGLKISRWPDDVWKGGKYREFYLDWRRQLMISSARQIARAVHTYDPYVCVSLAARPWTQHAYESDAQVWWEWANEGILDFICPMNYTTDPDKFVSIMKEGLPLLKGVIPYYSGIGMYVMKEYPPFKKNVELGRELGHDGFVAFEINSLLPVLKEFKTDLTKDMALLPHRAPETHFILEPGKGETEEGFLIFAPGEKVKFKVDVMFRAKLREGISRIKGDIVIQTVRGKIVEKIKALDLDQASITEVSVTCAKPGRYRLAFYGTMTLSTGEEKPFITTSFPFEISSS